MDKISEKIFSSIKKEEYEEVCDQCFGTGMECIVTEYNITYNSKPCLKCKGKGKWDWIDKIKDMKKLEEYEEECKECKGSGKSKPTVWFNICEKCGGKGKIDWIDKVKGFKKCKYCLGSGCESITTETAEINIRGMLQKIPIGYTKVTCKKCGGGGFEE